MRPLVLISFILSFAFGGCFPAARLLEPPNQFRPTDRVFAIGFDSTWMYLLRSVQDYPLAVIEKSSGVLDTDWITKTDTKHVKVWRGLFYGGDVEDDMPYDFREKFHILVIPIGADSTLVKIKRFVELRQWEMVEGPAGSWRPNPSGGFHPGTSTTIPENAILNKIEAFCQMRSSADPGH